MSVFNKDAGRILNLKETQAMKRAYRKRKLEAGLNSREYVRSEFFGINQVKYLLDQEGCVGLRIHHAKRWEDANGNPTSAGEGRLIPRVLLTGVDANGDDIPLYEDKAGIKDMPAGGIGGAVGVGPICPPHCKI